MAAIKVCWEIPFSKKSYPIEIGQLICQAINLLPFTWCEFSLKDKSQKTIRGGSGAAATFKMECFVIIVNSWKPLTIIPNTPS